MLKYSFELDIHAPLEKVSDLFGDHDNVKHWQPTLIRMEHVSGELRQQGAVHRLVHKMGNREVEMIETLVDIKPPHRFVATYEADKVWNRFACEFSDNGNGTTHWHMRSEFQCSGIMRVMIWVAPGLFRKQSRQAMRDFKAFAESA